MTKEILFVCTGNYFRSKFAEIYFNSRVIEKNLSWSAFSRGFSIENKNNLGLISIHTIKKLEQLQISIPRDLEVPQKVILHDLLRANKIIVLNEKEHKPFILETFPVWERKIKFWQINDIYEEPPESALESLKDEIDKLILNLLPKDT